METSDIIALIALIFSVLFGLANFLYTKHLNISRETKEAKFQQKQERIEANLFFEKIRNKKELFEDSLGDLLSNTIDEEKKKLFQRALTKFTSLFNEIEDFATIINDEAFQSNHYINETVLPEIKKLVFIQIDTFKTLNEFAASNGFTKLKRPDYLAFKETDKLLKKYYGENSTTWKEIVNNRKECGIYL